MSAIDDESPPEDFLERYLEKLEEWGRDIKTVDNYELAFGHFEEFLEERSEELEKDLSVENVTRKDANAFMDYLLEQDFARSTGKTYLGKVFQMYQYWNGQGFVEVNPFQEPLRRRKNQFSISNNKHRREISMQEMAEFVRSIEHPLEHVLVMTLSKTGKRVSEISNLDMRDVHIDHPRVKQQFPELRPEIENRPDTLYFADKHEMVAGKVTNGEERNYGNKSVNATIYPIEPELKQALIQYIAIRPPSSSPAKPLFVASTNAKDSTEERLSSSAIEHRIKRLVQPRGWHKKGASDNVTPHYFRSWWGTYFEDAVEDRGLVKYLRGDRGDITDEYRQNWGSMTRDKYLNNIFKFY